MAKGGTVIKQFLVALGFKTDKKSLGEFTGGLQSATKRVFVLGAAVTASAAVIGKKLESIARESEALGYLGERALSSIRGLEEAAYVSEQLGVSADTARQSVRGLGETLGRLPGAEGLLRRFGVTTRDANGTLRDTADILFDLGRQIRDMPRYRQEAILSRLGIPSDMLHVITKNVDEARALFGEMYATAGHDADAAKEDTRGFLNELRNVRTMATLAARAVTMNFAVSLRRDAERMRRSFQENFKDIVAVLTTVLSVIMRIAGYFGRVVMRGVGLIGKLLQWFNRLDPTVQKVIAAVVGLIAAWKLLNLSFLASPLGIVIGLIAALIFLVDDFFTYLEDGESLLDWSGFVKALEWIQRELGGIVDIIADIGRMFAALFSGDFESAAAAGVRILEGTADLIKAIFTGLASAIGYIFSAIWESVKASFPDFAAWAEGAAASIRSWLGEAIDSIKAKLLSLVGFLPDWVKEKLGIQVDGEPGPQGPLPEEIQGGFDQLRRAQEALDAMNNGTLAPDAAAQASMDQSRNVTMSQTTEITVTGDDPRATGEAVASAQRGVNADMQRNLQGAVQ